MSEAVCAGCGDADSIYREVEVHSSGWRDVTATIEADGKITYTEGSLDKGYDYDEDPDGFACSNCSHKASSIEDMVKAPEAPMADDLCCCGHSGHDHPMQKNYDKARFTRGRRSCEIPSCGCWEFETDPALATVVAA